MNYGRAVFILILLAIVSPNLFAQGIKVITGATLIDGTGSAPNKDAVIVIEGARIKQVGAKGKIEAPKDAVVIDARGKFVMPGLADMHNHLRDGMFSQKPQALTNARQLLTFGVTTIFFPNANLQLLARLKQEAASDNAPYPRIFGAGPIVTVKGGSLSGELRSPTTAEEARAVVKEMKAANVEAIKLGYQAFTSEVGAEQFNSFLTNTAFTKTQMPTLRANLKKINDAGILIVAGTDTGFYGVFPGLASHLELILHAEAGLKTSDIIKAATINAARMIGREKDFGTIEEGKLADMLILDANPLDDIRYIKQIHRVIKGGTVFAPAELLKQ